MKLTLSAEHEAFREEVRDFIEDNLPADTRRRVETGKTLLRDDYVRWQKILYDKGWIAPHWPVEYGGTGWDPIRRFVFVEELGRAPTPRIVPFGLVLIGPVLMAFGNDEQKSRYLPRILASEDWWCQGYSESGAGSDLAALQTKAVHDGDDYVVNGSKTWITHAQHADMMFCLVRTSQEEKRQLGISFLLIDMNSPGISVRPIRTFDGDEEEINEVHFADVRVPRDNLVGEEGKGWTYAKFLLSHERTGIGGLGRTKRWLEELAEIARAEQSGGRPLIEEPAFRTRLATMRIDLLALESMVLKVLFEEVAGGAPGPEASILKIKATELQQAITELAFEAVGQYALPYVAEAFADGSGVKGAGPDYAPPIARRYFNWRKASIYAGSNEIQRNIIAKTVLGF